jgi:Retrotransposon gag protein/Zinc knuckle
MDTPDPASSLAEGSLDIIQALQQRLALLEGERQSPSAIPGPAARPPGLALPSTFSGDSDEDPATWTFSFNQYFDLQATDRALRVPIAASQLRGSALLWWRMHHQTAEKGACGLITAWPEFCSAVEQQFSPINPTTTARNRLYSLAQRASVAAYADEFRKLILRVPDLSVDEQVNRFIHGLKPHIRIQVALREPTTLDQAVRVADTCDRLVPAPAGGRAPRYERKPASPSDVNPDVMQNGTVALPPLTPQQREQLRRTGGCFRCRKIGHSARDCPRDAEQRGIEPGKAGAQ